MIHRPIAAAWTTPRNCSDHGSDVPATALHFARADTETSEALIESLSQEAIRAWKLDDATYWQRVKFHARLIRATQRRRDRAADSERDDDDQQ